MRTWKAMFLPHILARGESYFEEGRVTALAAYGEGYRALVRGNAPESYTVEIEIYDGCIERMRCTCPHAADGYHCKHMAAALWAVEEGMRPSDDALRPDAQLEALDSRISCLLRAGQSDDDSYALEDALRQRYARMEELRLPRRQLDAFLARYSGYLSICLLRAERLLQEGDTDGAIRVLEERKLSSGQNLWNAEAYSIRLLRLYAQLGRRSELLEEYVYSIFTLGSGGLAMLLRLKELDPAQWPVYRARYLERRLPDWEKLAEMPE